MKTLALDIGDAWIGSAISDALGMFARPYQTVETAQLIPFLTQLLKEEDIATVVVGYPKTMRGMRSEQTEKIESTFKELQEMFKNVTWLLWDERLSSKRADALKKATTKDDKRQSHSVAAAFILSSYLDYKSFQNQTLDIN